MSRHDVAQARPGARTSPARRSGRVSSPARTATAGSAGRRQQPPLAGARTELLARPSPDGMHRARRVDPQIAAPSAIDLPGYPFAGRRSGSRNRYPVLRCSKPHPPRPGTPRSPGAPEEARPRRLPRRRPRSPSWPGSRSASSGRCSSRARPAWARPTSRARSPRRLVARARAPAVLRGARRGEGPLRVGLRQADALHAAPARRGRRRRRRARRRSPRRPTAWRAPTRRSSAGASSSRARCSRALTSDEPVVLLIDEVDRADPEFEAFLLEILAERQVTIPELGTVRAKTRAALRPHEQRHARDDRRPPPPVPARLRRLPAAVARAGHPRAARARAWREALAGAARGVRAEASARSTCARRPSIAETIDWARALVAARRERARPELARSTLGVLLKHEEDRAKVEAQARALLRRADSTLPHVGHTVALASSG